MIIVFSFGHGWTQKVTIRGNPESYPDIPTKTNTKGAVVEELGG